MQHKGGKGAYNYLTVIMFAEQIRLGWEIPEKAQFYNVFGESIYCRYWYSKFEGTLRFTNNFVGFTTRKHGVMLFVNCHNQHKNVNIPLSQF